MFGNIISVRNLTKTFPHQAKPSVSNLSFDLKQGEILGLLGPNGAGKTTTIQMLLGTLTPTQGTISYFDKDFYKHRSEILDRVGFASTYVSMPDHLSIFENLKIQGLLYGLSHTTTSERINYFLDKFHLNEKKNAQFGALSAGQKTRVLLVKAFLHNPQIVLLDEPTAALDPDIAEQIRTFILDEQKERKLSVFFTSHNMEEITYLCDRVIVLRNGSLFADDTPNNLSAQVSTTHVNLTFLHGFEKIVAYATQNNLSYYIKENIFSCQVNENNIASLLNDLAKNEISFSHISIDKPSLESYFLHIAKKDIP